ncbi:corrinoid protein [Opitutus sp. ER46]|uniref:cobalamin B12-binding domain-containing protein n=1 Tax=Opitutus sp. ER46 TaxID=2161864 RepID=UPI000D2FEBBA|nr:corrinoid protein [Opitutus sp. ER46]PTX94365.1 cobalamin-binding protein [Opitutus sp. ER46]
MTTLEQLGQAVIGGKSKDAKAFTQKALDEGTGPAQLVDNVLVPAMATIGERFKRGEVFVPEMLIAARAMKESMLILEPRLAAAGVTPKYTAVIGTVMGDLHDIGKNLVAIMWKGAGFKVVDLGTNVPPAKFVAAVREHSPHVVGVSALLTTTMPAMAQTVAALHAPDCPRVKVVIGGAPVTQQYADEIKADGYAADAASAVDVALRVVAA